MLFLTMHSALFYLRLYGIGHIVKDHSDTERGIPLPPLHGLFYMYHPTDRIAHTTAFVPPVVEIAQWIHHDGSIRRPIAH